MFGLIVVRWFYTCVCVCVCVACVLHHKVYAAQARALPAARDHCL